MTARRIAAFLLAGVAVSYAQTLPLPRLQKNGEVTQMVVDGKPFLILAGELHNSSASSIAYMKPIWDKLAKLRLNTVIGTVSWELLEPEEGKFDFTLVDAQIRDARLRNLRLVLIWFATWKNGNSTYVPIWVKMNPQRFPRTRINKQPNPGPFFGEGMETLSPFGEASLAADAKAFRALMRHIRAIDPQHTVIMMQVENEPGLLGDSRDRSPLAEAAFAGPVPAELLNYFAKNKASLLPEMQAVWGARGFKTSGSWADVFGTDPFAEEVFMAWHIARYIGKVAEAGKAELSLPMYANAWLGPQPRMDLPGQYPSGGPVARVLDVWRAAAPSIDMLAPDIYVDDFKGTCALYARSGNPLFIPEARAIPGSLFWALGQHAALGFSPFGIEDLSEQHQLANAYQVLGELMPLITKHQAEGKIMGILVDGETPQSATFAGYKLTVSSVRRFPWMLAEGQQAMDQPGRNPPDRRPMGLVMSTGPDEFLIAGAGLAINFEPDSPGPKESSIGWIDEGVYEKGRWTPGRRLNGDEGRPAIPFGPIKLLKVRLYRHD